MEKLIVYQTITPILAIYKYFYIWNKYHLSAFLSILTIPRKLQKKLEISEHNQFLESDILNTAHSGGGGDGDGIVVMVRWW